MIKSVTTLTNASAATILTPGPQCRFISIQNVGAGAVNLTFDGGSTYIVPGSNPARTGTDPTTTATGLGYQLPATTGSLLLVVNAGGNSLRLPIRAILQTATATQLNICTDDAYSV